LAAVKKMKKVSKVLLISLFSLIGLFLLLIGFVWLSRDKIKQYAVTQLNEQLTAPVAVKSIDINFFEQFPRVSLQLNDVKIADPLRSKRVLLQAQRLFIAFNINDILTQQYKIQLIEADSGLCHLFINDKGKANYMIVKETGENNEDIFLELHKIKLTNMRVVYEDLQSKQYYDMDAHDVTVSGDFKGKKESLSAEGDVLVDRMKTGSMVLVKNKEVKLDIALNINEALQKYVFDKGEIELGSLHLNCKGSIINQPKFIDLNLTFAADKLSITDLLELLPGSMSSSFKEYKSDGNIYFKGAVKGKLTDKDQPAIDVSFGIENGTLKASGQNISLTNIQCQGTFSNGSKRNLQTSSLSFPSLSFAIGSGSVKGSLFVTNFSNPDIDAAMAGTAGLDDLIRFTQSKWIKSAEGNLAFDVKVKGNVKELSSKQGFMSGQTSGTITCDAHNIVFEQGNKTIETIQTSFTLDQQNLTINHFKASIDKSDITISGTLQNIIPYLLTEKQTITASILYKSDYMNLQHLVLPIPESTNSSNTFALPQFIVVNADVMIDKLEFYEFKASKIKGNIYWRGKKIETENLQCETMSGKLFLKGQIENAPDGRFLVSSNINCSEVNMNELFRQCANFGQKEITDKHIQGILTANIDLVGVWSEKMDCDMDKLYATADITVTDGQLNNYEPMEALSKYVKVEDLRNLRFAELKNRIEIKSKKIFVPSMDIQNNALNVNIAGTHTFDNYMDYHIKLRLNELLAKKRKKATTNEFEEEETNDKGLNLYLSMKGPADNLVFSYDKKEARQKVKQDLKKEGESIKNVLKKELGLEKDETIKEKKSDNDELEFEPE
jgi:hypothetical protein